MAAGPVSVRLPAPRSRIEGRPSAPDHHVITQPLVTLAVAGGQKVVDALR